MTTEVPRPLDITIVSDVICPWCFIGTRRLDQVLATMPDVDARIQYRAFLLDPTVPPEGADLRDRLRKKYGADPEAMFVRIEQAARDTGIPLDFSNVRRTPNTIPAHTLLRHAAARGTQRQLSDALFSAYFLHGQDISAPDVLAAIAEATTSDPVTVIRSMRGSVVIISPTSLPPVTMLMTPLGKFSSAATSAMISAENGVNGDGFSTTVLPVIRAGNSFTMLRK